MTLLSLRAAATGGAADRVQPAPGDDRHLYGRVADFLCLGGVSFVLLPIVFLLPEKELTPTFGMAALIVGIFINYPHFAMSYQIFYQGFRTKAFGANADASLRARYLFAGIAVPVAFAAFLAGGMISGDVRLVGYGAGAMGFLVGWHYVKQGYGMLMVDAALKRRYFAAAEKKVLLINCYAVWAFAWLAVNAMLAERTVWGIRYAMLPVPSPLLTAAGCVAAATTALTIATLIKKWRADGGRLPMNGTVAYAVSLYLWLLLMHRNLLWLAVVPALHSLQYLAVAARYQWNRSKAATAPEGSEPPGRAARRGLRRRHAGFLALAVGLGFLGFLGAPILFQTVVPYDRAVFGSTAFMFVFWVFINVHHYFLDNVMWRSRNPEIRKYLFA